MKKQDFDIINVSALARRLSRSRQWFYQRLNGNTVNGKKAVFTESERSKIAAELRTIQGEIGVLADLIIGEKKF